MAARRDAPAGAGGAPRRLTGWKRWAFPLAAAVLVPAACLLLLELLLRAAGYGYPTRFFLPYVKDGQKMVTDNVRFGWTFHPPTVAREPQDFIVPARKPDDTFRIFVLGESAAWGDPDPSFALGRILETMLAERHPGLRFEVINAAMAAINSHVVLPIARDAARQSPDLFIVYMGNNEVIGPYGPGTAFADFSRSLTAIRAAIWLRTLKVSQALYDLKVLIGGRGRQPQTWTGMQMFRANSIRATDPRLERMYAHFTANLADICRAGERAGARVILCTMAANLNACAPFGSLGREDMDASATRQWHALYEKGRELAAAGDTTSALHRLREAVRIDDTHADLHYQVAKCLEGAGRTGEAYDEYVTARELDTLRFRSDTRINGIIRGTAQQRKLPLVDVVRIFDAASTSGIAGHQLLVDHVHMNFAGNHLIARSLLPEVEAAIAARRGTQRPATTGTLTESECAARLAYTGFNRFRIAGKNLKRVENPPFTDQSDNAWQRRVLGAELDAARHFDTPEGLARCAAEYDRALAARPDDWIIHENYADLLQRAGRSGEETRQLRRVLELVPHHLERNAWLGQSLANQGRLDEALECYDRALRHDSTDLGALKGRAGALMRQGRREEAVSAFARRTRLRPNSGEAHNDLGEALMQLGRTKEAEASFRRAAEVEPGFVFAHANLGMMLMRQGRLPDAADSFRRAIEANPLFLDGHVFLGDALLQSGDAHGALAAWEEGLRVKGKSPLLLTKRAAALSTLGRAQDAIASLRQAMAADAKYLPARRGLAMTLAQNGDKVAAAAELREALAIVPDDATCLEMLRDIESNR